MIMIEIQYRAGELKEFHGTPLFASDRPLDKLLKILLKFG